MDAMDARIDRVGESKFAPHTLPPVRKAKSEILESVKPHSISDAVSLTGIQGPKPGVARKKARLAQTPAVKISPELPKLKAGSLPAHNDFYLSSGNLNPQHFADLDLNSPAKLGKGLFSLEGNSLNVPPKVIMQEQ